MKGIDRKTMYIMAGSVLVAVLALTGSLIISSALNKNARKKGEELGKKVGTAVGSYQGFTSDYKSAQEKAEAEEKQKKLEENNIKYAQRMRQTEKLDVLMVTFNVVDEQEVGKEYSAVLFAKAHAIFSVDMGKADVSMSEDNVLTITLPQPQVEVYIDENSITKESEMNRLFFDGNAEDGFDAYLDSMVKMEENSKTKAYSNQKFWDEARDSAEQQVRRLANGVSVNAKSVQIIWKEE